MRRDRAAGREGRGVLLAGLAALLAVLALLVVGFAPLTRVGQLVFDAYLRASPRPYEAAPVRIVDINEESLRRLG